MTFWKFIKTQVHYLRFLPEKAIFMVVLYVSFGMAVYTRDFIHIIYTTNEGIYKG